MSAFNKSREKGQAHSIKSRRLRLTFERLGLTKGDACQGDEDVTLESGHVASETRTWKTKHVISASPLKGSGPSRRERRGAPKQKPAPDQKLEVRGDIQDIRARPDLA
jgi:hypothetical protein